MEINEYINQSKELYDILFEFIECEDNNEEYFNRLTDYYKAHENEKSKEKLRLILKILSNLTKNHNRKACFIQKIEEILIYFQNEIKQTFSNLDMTQFFEDNKIILLFLITKKIIIVDKTIAHYLIHIKDTKSDKKFIHYFFNEIRGFLDSKRLDEIEFEFSSMNSAEKSNFDLNRQKGENESYLCELIRNDSIQEFVSYVNRSNIKLTTTIEQSIFETNSIILSKEPTLIEYAAFYGSIQIFQFLKFSGVHLDPLLLKYAIHSKNAELIHVIEENLEKPFYSYFLKIILEEAIKCHHNDIAEYIINNYGSKMDEYYCYGLKYYNFYFMPEKLNEYEIDFFYHLCEFNNSEIATLFLKYKKIKIDLNKAVEICCLNDSFDVLQVLFNNKIIGFNELKKCKKLIRISIPSFVKKIKSNSFRNCKLLLQISFDDDNNKSIVSFGNSSFRDCSSLMKITIPSSIELIKDLVFDSCVLLSEIEFEENSSLKAIGCRAFENCCSLKSIKIPSTVELIGPFAFYKCSELQQIDIFSSKLASIETNLFDSCSLLTKIKIPSSVTSIKSSAFKDCIGLKKFVFPSSVIKIGSYAFYRCSSLNQIEFEDGSKLDEINDYAFKFCTSLIKFIAPSSLVKIGNSAFDGCQKLSCFLFEGNEPSIQSIGSFAFRDCNSLKSISIPSSTKIGIGMKLKINII